MSLICSTPDCGRGAARRVPMVGGPWFCVYHPESDPPPVGEAPKVRDARLARERKAAEVTEAIRRRADQQRQAAVVKEQRAADALRRREAGQTAREARRVRPAGVQGTGRIPNPLDAEDVVRRYRAGQGSDSIARALHVRSSRVRAVLVDAGITLSHVNVSRADPSEIILRYGLGHSIRVIARDLHCSQPVVSRVLHAAGMVR